MRGSAPFSAWRACYTLSACTSGRRDLEQLLRGPDLACEIIWLIHQEVAQEMKRRVTKEGLLIPREVLERLGSEPGREVEILEERDRVLVIAADEVRPNVGAKTAGEDPILSLGEDPVDDEVTDASVNHDFYLYGSSG